MKKRDKVTSRTTDQVGFWQPCSSEWSKRLLLPNQADSVTTDSASRPSTTDAGTRDSWFSVRQSLPKSSHIRSLPGALWHRVSPVEVAEQTVDVTKPLITGVKKVRFRPTPKQKSTCVHTCPRLPPSSNQLTASWRIHPRYLVFP